MSLLGDLDRCLNRDLDVKMRLFTGAMCAFYTAVYISEGLSNVPNANPYRKASDFTFAAAYCVFALKALRPQITKNALVAGATLWASAFLIRLPFYADPSAYNAACPA